MDSQRVPRSPRDITLNGVAYEVIRDKDGQYLWQEDPVAREAPFVDEVGLNRVVLPDGSYLLTKTIDSWHMGMGDAYSQEPYTYHYSQDADASYPGQIILGPLQTTLAIGVSPGGDPWGFAEIGGRLYVVFGRYTREIGTLLGTPTDTADADAGAGNTFRDARLFRNRLWLSRGSGAVLQSRPSGAAPQVLASAAAGLTADFQAVTEAFLYRVDSDSTPAIIAACPVGSDPDLAASWANPTDFDVASAAMTGLGAFGYQVVIGQQDGVRVTNREGRIPNLLEEARSFVSAVNGRRMQVYGGNLYIPHVLGLLRYDGGGLQSVGLEKLPSNLGPVRGVYRALASDGRWLYVWIWDGTNSWLLRYTEERDRAIWHCLARWASNQVTGAHVTGISDPATLWSTSVTNNTIERRRLPQNTGNPLQDSSYTYAASSSLWQGRQYMGLPYSNKNFLEIVAEVENLSADETVQILRRQTAEVPWSATSPAFTSVGTYNNSIVSGTRLTLSNVSGTFIELRYDHARGSTTTNCPVLRRVTIRALARPTYFRYIRCQVRLPGESQEQVTRAPVEASYETLRNLEGGTTAVTLLDVWGISRTVFLTGAVRTNAIIPGAGMEPGVVAQLTMIEP